MKPAAFVGGGTDVQEVEVMISYGIIQRFSEGLYSSPNKAFEELVSNSYDAGATQVWIEMPADLTADDATVVVLDNGESMDLEGLKELWRIGESTKRSGGPDGGERVVSGRDPIGKFGIGKLATYVLADELTYVCRRGDEYRAVTMDYSRVTGNTELVATHPMQLESVRLTAGEARGAIEAIAPRSDADALESFFDDEPDQ